MATSRQPVTRVQLPTPLHEPSHLTQFKPHGPEWNAIASLFPTVTEIGFDYLYLVVGVKILPSPAQCWPTFIEDLPLWLTNTPRRLPFARGTTSRAFLGFGVEGDIREYENPVSETIVQILGLVNGKAGREVVDRVSWDGLQFFGYGEKEPEEGWRTSLPSRVNGFSFMYVWGEERVEQKAWVRRPLELGVTKRAAEMRSGDAVFLKSDSGIREGCHIKTVWRLPSKDQLQEGLELGEITHFSYFGNGERMLDDGSGGVVWDKYGKVLGHARYQEHDGQRLVCYTSFELLTG